MRTRPTKLNNNSLILEKRGNKQAHLVLKWIREDENYTCVQIKLWEWSFKQIFYFLFIFSN